MTTFDKDYKEAQLRRLQDELRLGRQDNNGYFLAFLAGLLAGWLVGLAFLAL